MRIALDVEGVLADSHNTTIERSDLLTYDHFQEWDFPTDEHWDEYAHVSQNVWHNHWEEIPSVEPNIALDVAVMRERNQVDILTNRTGVDEQIQAWLDDHDIEYDEFTATSKRKRTFDEYDFFIDDNPNMVGEVDHLMLRSQPWNQDVEVDGVNTIRVDSLKDAATKVVLGQLTYSGSNE